MGFLDSLPSRIPVQTQTEAQGQRTSRRQFRVIRQLADGFGVATYNVPQGVYWRIHALYATINPCSVYAPRFFQFRIFHNTLPIYEIDSPAINRNITTAYLTLFPNANNVEIDTQNGLWCYTMAIPDLPLFGGDQLRCVLGNNQATDYLSIELAIDEMTGDY
jgi:hypothetical protein